LLSYPVASANPYKAFLERVIECSPFLVFFFLFKATLIRLKSILYDVLVLVVVMMMMISNTFPYPSSNKNERTNEMSGTHTKKVTVLTALSDKCLKKLKLPRLEQCVCVCIEYTYSTLQRRRRR